MILEYNVLNLSPYPEFNWAASVVLVWFPILLAWKMCVRTMTRT